MKLSTLEKFEIQAYAFHRMTGIMAPGKDESPCCGISYDERKDKWDAWLKEYSPVVIAMIEAVEYTLLDSEQSHSENIKEQLADFIVKHGFATGHGDTVKDLLSELDWQVSDRNNRLSTWHRISNILRSADNSSKYLGLHIIYKGQDIGTVRNLLVEMTPLTNV